MPFRFQRLGIPGLLLVEAERFGDARGFFLEAYRQSAFDAAGITERFVQINRSRSVRGVLRGLHYQKPPKAQAKLLSVLAGEIFDVAVDIRRGSPTYGRWEGVSLTAENARMIFVPAGFAHGFCVLSREAEILYQVSAEYAPALDRGLRWDDPAVGVRWPVSDPLLSPKDAALPLLAGADNPFVWP